MKHLPALLAACALSGTLNAGSVKLAWNPNPEDDISGYRVSYGTSPGVHNQSQSTGNETSTTVHGLTDGQTYYFVLRAVNTSGLESEPCGEISQTLPARDLIARTGWSVHFVDSEETPDYAAHLAIDGNPATFWHTSFRNGSTPPPHDIQIDLGQVESIAGFRYLPRQDSYTIGDIADYEFYVSADGMDWGSPAATGCFDSGKHEKEVIFPAASGRFVMLRQLSEVNGTNNCTVAELSLIRGGSIDTPPPPPSASTLIDRGGWSIHHVDSEETPTYAAENAIDDNPATFWHTAFINGTIPPPHEIQIDLGQVETIAGLRYLPRQDAYDPGGIAGFDFHVSMDGVNWGGPVASGTFDDSKAEKEVSFPSISARYVMLRQLSEINGLDDCSVAEINLIRGEPVDAPPAANRAPTAAAAAVSTDEDVPLAITLTASDPDGDTLIWQIVDGPAMGSLSGSAPELTYTPAPDANGTDSFTFRVGDGTLQSATATVSISIRPVNDAPVAGGQSVTTSEDHAVGILLQASDKDGDPLTYRIEEYPANGQLTGSAPNFTYAPNRDSHGTVTFTFVANDGTVDSETATVTITVTPVNDPPVVMSRMVSTPSDKPLALTLHAADADGDVLSYRIVSQPMKGRLSGSAPNLTYTPNPRVSGADSVSYQVSDGTVDSKIATVFISLTAPLRKNQPPVFVEKHISRSLGTAAADYICTPLEGTAIDPDGDLVAYEKSAGPDWLIVTANGAIGGTPPSGAVGLNIFTIRARDPEGAFSEAVLEIQIDSTDLPLPWNMERIGGIGDDSTAHGEADSFTLSGAGSLAGNSDSGLFVWQTLTGDGGITARISSLENAGSSSRIGLMIRESPAADSKHAFIGVDSIGYVRWVRRSHTGGRTSISAVAMARSDHVWLRLVRVGGTIRAFTSTNGSNWSQVASANIDLGASSYIGLMTSSGGEMPATAVFNNVMVTP